jgi:diacylglycerol kinase family enzyme
LINYNDRIVIIGGDGSVSKAINLIIELTAQRDENLNLCDIENIRTRLKTPICIISAGSTNMIANTIYGTTDHNTPLMHLFYGYYYYYSRHITVTQLTSI